MKRTEIKIKDMYGKILGYIEETENGKTVRDFYRKILGYYDKKRDITLDYYRRIVGRGDQSSALIFMNTK